MRPSHRVAGRAAVAASFILAGCLGETPPSQPAHQTARQLWDTRAWPTLATCAGCHGSQPAIDFLAPNTDDGAYTNVFAFQPPVIDVEVPAASLLLTMGKHTGPAFSAEQASAVIAWLEAEHEERMPSTGQTVRIGPFLPTPGTSQTLDLGIGGATITLVPDESEAGLYFSHVEVSAGSGIHLSHPLFVSRPPKPILDELDRFSMLDTKLAAGAQLELGPEWFIDFSPTDYLSIHFSTLEAP